MGDRSHGKRVNSKRRRLARDYQRQHGCSYRTALQAVQKNEPTSIGRRERLNILAMEIKSYITPLRPLGNHVRDTLNANDAPKAAAGELIAWEDFFRRESIYNLDLGRQCPDFQKFMPERRYLAHDQKFDSGTPGVVDVASLYPPVAVTSEHWAGHAPKEKRGES